MELYRILEKESIYFKSLSQVDKKRVSEILLDIPCLIETKLTGVANDYRGGKMFCEYSKTCPFQGVSKKYSAGHMKDLTECNVIDNLVKVLIENDSKR